MRTIKRLFSTILLLALLAGVAYGYLWYSTKSYLDQQIAAASHLGEVTYQQLLLDPRGEVRVEGIQVVPSGFRSTIELGVASMRSSDPLFFLEPAERIERGEFPEFLALEIDGLAFDPYADFIAALQPSQADLLLQLRAPQVEALGCGDQVLAFTPDIWRKMGIGRLDSDVAITLRANNPKGTLELFSESETAGMGVVSADLSLTFAAGYLKPGFFAAANPRLKALEFSYRDTGYFAKRDRFCAANIGLDEAGYRKAHIDLVKQRAAQYGMQVPELLWQAYASSNAKGADVRFGVNPVGGLGAEAMMSLGEPLDLISRLRMHLEINGRPVDLNQVDWLALMPDPQVTLESLEQSAQAPVESQVDSAAERVETPVAQMQETAAAEEFPGMPARPEAVPEVEFRRTSFDELPNYIYSDIRIFTYYGNRVEGRLEAVEGDSIKILHRVGKGLAIYPVDRTKLEVIEVMR